jgi:hypothetical protein
MSSNLSAPRHSYSVVNQVDAFTFSLSDTLSLRIYSSTKPCNLKIADLQKGLLLIINGEEAIGEGAGFGLPVLVYSDETYFSGTSNVYARQMQSRSVVIVKEFIIDRVARNTLGNVTLENCAARSFIEYLSDLYQKHRRFRLLSLKRLTGRMNIGKAFPPAPSRGKVTVTYTLSKLCTHVRSDFKEVKKDRLQKIFLLNEQGSRFFRRYTDSSGTELRDEKIGAWDGTDGEWACLHDRRGEVGFRLWRMQNSVLRRGREFLEGSLDWVGLDYEISPRSLTFEYPIDFLEE